MTTGVDRMFLDSIVDHDEGQPGLDMSRACMVADTLAWAVSANMPLQDALRSLPFYRNFAGLGPKLRKPVSIAKDSMAPFRPYFWLTNTRWAWNVRMMIHDIENGEPLSSALERNLGRHFPAFYLMGLARAEAKNCVETALPVLAKQMCYPAAVASERKAFSIFVLFKIMFAMNILMFFFINILPKFADIYKEIAGLQLPFAGFEPVVSWLQTFTAAGFITIVIIAILSRTEGIGEYVVLRIPFLGREWKRFIISDLARSMAAFIRQGEDILGAADWSRKATRSRFIRNKLDLFIRSAQNGTCWVDAWNEMRLGAPLDQWIIRNAASREDPASGFELIAEWTHYQIAVTTRRLEQWLDPCCALILGVFVAFIAYWSFSCITNVARSLI